MIDLNDILLELKGLYSGPADKDIKVNYRSSPDCRVLANGLLKDVFSNLVGNAVKHTPGDHVAINMRLNSLYVGDKKYYKVAIEDHGPGIPDELKPRIFDRFERGNTKARGKGLGLYLVKTLVDDFHGKAWVEDRVPGDLSKGSRFIVMLPAIEGEAASARSCVSRIGIVEDDIALMNLYKMIFARQGMPVGPTAINGIEAVEMVKNADPGLDIIIMDHRMPGMSGLEAMREMLKIAPHIKVIFISADMSIEEDALKSGASMFLHKPVIPQDIVQAVNDVLKIDGRRRSVDK